MQFKSLLTLENGSDAAVQDLTTRAAGFDADLAVLFASHHHGPDFQELIQGIHAELNVRNLIGCSGESIIGPDSEVEHQPAAALWMAQLPEVRLLPFLMDQEDLESLQEQPAEAFADRLGVHDAEHSSFIILADPFTFDIHSALQRLDQAYPGAYKVGGMASGAEERGQNRLFLGDQVLRHGMVGVALSGAVAVETVVSQGCRPIAQPYVVTRASANIIEEIGGREARDVLKDVFEQCDEDEQGLMRNGLHLGVVIDEGLDDYTAGDFLIHNVLGLYQTTKLAISSPVRAGQTVQFHVRDKTIADGEMSAMLASKGAALDTRPAGGLLFSCNGRGQRLFGTPHHDIQLVNQAFEECSVAGFFAQGEIGPVGGRTFVHGFTSSLILFRDRGQEPA